MCRMVAGRRAYKPKIPKCVRECVWKLDGVEAQDRFREADTHGTVGFDLDATTLRILRGGGCVEITQTSKVLTRTSSAVQKGAAAGARYHPEDTRLPT